jgi:hypothetical protein
MNIGGFTALFICNAALTSELFLASSYLFSAAAVPILADYFGRRHAAAIGIIILLVGVVIQGA